MKSKKTLSLILAAILVLSVALPITAAGYASVGKIYTLKIAGKKQKKKSAGRCILRIYN